MVEEFRTYGSCVQTVCCAGRNTPGVECMGIVWSLRTEKCICYCANFIFIQKIIPTPMAWEENYFAEESLRVSSWGNGFMTTKQFDRNCVQSRKQSKSIARNYGSNVDCVMCKHYQIHLKVVNIPSHILRMPVFFDEQNIYSMNFVHISSPLGTMFNYEKGEQPQITQIPKAIRNLMIL